MPQTRCLQKSLGKTQNPINCISKSQGEETDTEKDQKDDEKEKEDAYEEIRIKRLGADLTPPVLFRVSLSVK